MRRVLNIAVMTVLATSCGLDENKTSSDKENKELSGDLVSGSEGYELASRFVDLGLQVLGDYRGSEAQKMLGENYAWPINVRPDWRMRYAKSMQAGGSPEIEALARGFDGMEIFGVSAMEFFDNVKTQFDLPYVNEEFSDVIARLPVSRFLLIPTIHKNNQGEPVCLTTSVDVSAYESEASLPTLVHTEDERGEGYDNAMNSYLQGGALPERLKGVYFFEYMSAVFSKSDNAAGIFRQIPVYRSEAQNAYTMDHNGERKIDVARYMEEFDGDFQCAGESCKIHVSKVPVSSDEDCSAIMRLDQTL